MVGGRSEGGGREEEGREKYKDRVQTIQHA